MATQKVGDFQLVDHGVNGSQYFSGCGIAFTNFGHVATGIGDNPREALDDLIEMVSQSGFDVSGLRERVIESCGSNSALVAGDLPEKPSAYKTILSANGFSEEPKEPDRDDFGDDVAYENATEEYEAKAKEYRELLDACDCYYYLSLRWLQG